jgi:AraC-like DNA-binding protein
MQRHLAEHGTSIRQMVMDERIRMATEHLALPHATVSALVPILGFSEVSAVSRFLKEHGIETRPRTEPARGRSAMI